MRINDFNTLTTSEKLNNILETKYGYNIDLNKLNLDKANRMLVSMKESLQSFRRKVGEKALNDPTYLEKKMVIETLQSYLKENEDQVSVDDLITYADNERSLHNQQYVPILKNLLRKMKKEIYDHELAVKLWRYYTDNAAKQYMRDVLDRPSSDAQFVIPGAVRNQAAKVLADREYEELKRGQYDHLLESYNKKPKKTTKKKPVAETTEQRLRRKLRAIQEGDSSVRMKDISGPTRRRRVVEGTEEAEVVLASKDMVDRFQKIIKDIGEMQNEELLPLVDSIRSQMGDDVASKFDSTMSEALSSAMESIKSARDQADSATRVLTGDTDTIGADPDMDIDADEVDIDAEVDDIGGDEDGFGVADAAVGGEEELGRGKRDEIDLDDELEDLEI